MRETTERPRGLVVSDANDVRGDLVAALQKAGCEVEAVSSATAARRLLKRASLDILVLDLALPDDGGLKLLRIIESRIRIQVIVFGEGIGIESIAEAMRLGACEYMPVPIDWLRIQALLDTRTRSVEPNERIEARSRQLREAGRFGAFCGTSPAMRSVYELIAQVAPTDACVLIEGESGTGKELVAHSIHELSRRHRGPFIAVNCGAISPQLMESALFGHERGSFTGAERLHRGLFECAAGGTLFLDEISEMPAELQAKLLRVLERSEVRRIGGQEVVRYDVRILAATNRSPEQAVADGKLRQDLLYRLRVFPIRLPALRERQGDLQLLAGSFLCQLNRAAGTSKHLTVAAMEGLPEHRWPGNVRELKNVIQKAFIVATDEITPQHLLGSPAAFEDPVGVTQAHVTLRMGTSPAEAERRSSKQPLPTAAGTRSGLVRCSELDRKLCGTDSKQKSCRLRPVAESLCPCRRERRQR